MSEAAPRTRFALHGGGPTVRKVMCIGSFAAMLHDAVVVDDDHLRGKKSFFRFQNSATFDYLFLGRLLKSVSGFCKKKIKMRF
jgi:hypothetical protein